MKTDENLIKLSTLKAINTMKKEHIKLGIFAVNLYIHEVMRLVNLIFPPTILQKIAFLCLPNSLNFGTDAVFKYPNIHERGQNVDFLAHSW